MHILEKKELKAEELDPNYFLSEKMDEIRNIASGTGGLTVAINALSGGVDSSVVTLLGHMAFPTQAKTYFIDNGLMREGEPESVVSFFRKHCNIPVVLVNAQEEFFKALRGIVGPEEKREAITRAFYREVFGPIIKSTGASFLLQGTILTDIEETKAGIKRQHNIFEQIGIDPQKEFGYKIIEPLKQLRKDGVRKVAEALGLPDEICQRMSFPWPALAARVIGEATPERIEIVRKATVVVEEEIFAFVKNWSWKDFFQCLAILHEDKVTGIVDGKRKLGLEIQLRCWDSVDARTAIPTKLPDNIVDRIDRKIRKVLPDVVNVAWNSTPKPPSAIEAV